MQRIMIRRIAAFLALSAIGSADALAATRPFPSLAKRPVESRGQQTEAPPAPVETAAPDAALVTTVAALQAKAAAADTAFKAELGKDRSAVSTANGAAPSSEPWVAAQTAISAADAARYDAVAALASLDTLHVDRQDSTDGARIAADLATIDPARTRVLAMVDAQNDALDALRATLTNP